ncbi:hypothetical protein MNB_SV-14-325 [hydrothermal vent metagenome]|uniref:Uncharacterized protein n=2 Tax=hydrothermal vent metagenome TaxID=652676 RepID=A0A1W1C348_9ZZZZ
MKLKEVAEIIRGAYLVEGKAKSKKKACKELTMVSLEPISFLDERKFLEIKCENKASAKQLTKAGDIIVGLYHPMIACYVEKGQEGYVVPHYMAIVRRKPYVKLDSRFIVQFINSTRGRRALAEKAREFDCSNPSSLPLATLSNVELLRDVNRLIERF